MQTGILVPHTAASNRPTRIDNSMQPRPCPFIGKRPHPGTRAAPLQNVLSAFLPLIQPSDAACPKIHPPGSVVQKSIISISAGRYIFLAHYPPIDQNFFSKFACTDHRSSVYYSLRRNAHPERAISSGGERFPDTEEVTSSNLVSPTNCYQAIGFPVACFFINTPIRAQQAAGIARAKRMYTKKRAQPK